jgi:hypothetical protein
MSAVRRYTYLAETAVLGGQEIINLDPSYIVFEVSVLVDIVSGDANYSIEFSLDDVESPQTMRWFSDAMLPQGQTSTGLFKLTTAVTAIRLNLQALTGEVRLSVIQGFE